METKDDLQKFFEFISGTIFNYEDLEFPKFFNNSYLAGENVLYQKNVSETKKFDDSWITTIESYFPSLDKITKNPRSHIAYTEEVIDIERAKKINSRSVQHLAQHSEYIKDIDKNDNIIPSKILTTFSDQDYAIYENRFIATLINRLFIFVRNRLEVIKSNVESFQKDHIKVQSQFDLEGNDIDITIDLVVKRDLDNKTINEHNFALLERVEKLSGLIDGLKGSQFMKMMKNCKVVHPPIIKTNIINKNPDFRNAYTLWLFLDRYSTLGYDVDVKEKDLTFDNKFKHYIDGLVLLNFSTIVANQQARAQKYNAIEYEEYTRKRKKISKANPEDFVDNPDVLQMEDNSLNEYFLNKYRRLFDQSVEELEENGEVETDEAIRRAIRKTMDIVNSLYESVFRLEEENDVFRKLVDTQDNNKEYEIKKNQLKYARIIREVKEVDYNRSMRQEKRLLKELEKINLKFLKQKVIDKNKEKDVSKKAQMEADIENLKKVNLDYQKRIENLEKIDAMTKEEKENLAQMRADSLNKTKEELAAFVKEIKDREALERESLKKTLKEQTDLEKKNVERINKALEQKKARNDKLIEEENQKRIDYLTKEKTSLETKLKEKLAKEKAALEKRQKQEAERLKKLQEDNEQKERERVAIQKVKAYEARIKLEMQVKKLRSQLKVNPK